MKTMLGWHFSAANKRLGYEDGRLIRAGKTLKVDCEPVLCESGLHAGSRLIDALGYAPGPYLWRVKLSGVVVRGVNKAVATERTALWGFDASDMLREFARKCALDVIHLWDAPEVVMRYLKTGDESIRSESSAAAEPASWASSAAARSSSAAAARSASWAGAEPASAAAWGAASWAASAAAWGAASWAAAEEAVAAQNARLLRMVRKWRTP